MIHVVLSVIALILGALAAMSGASGFWTGCFVGAVMATSGLKWAKHAWSEALKAQVLKEAQLAAREAALQKAIQKMEADKTATPAASQQAVAPVAATPPPPPPPVNVKSKPPTEVTPKPGPAPLPDEVFQPAMQWPPLSGNASFEMPPN
jgi:hypothetical protein